jgi:hypothetical protein
MTSSRTLIPSVSGIAVLDLLRAIEEITGTEAFLRARDELPPAVRAELDTINAVSWVPNETLNIVIDGVARAAALDPETMLDRAIRSASQRTFRTVWRMLLRITSDDALIKRTPMVYSRSRNVGQLTARLQTPGTGEVILSDWPDVSERTLRSIGVGIQSVLEIAGRRDVRMSFARTSEGGRYELRWRA